MNRVEYRSVSKMARDLREKVRRYIMDIQDARRASNLPDPVTPVRREADTMNLEDPIKTVTTFEAPTSPRNVQIKPTPISTGTQTWPTTKFRSFWSPEAGPSKSSTTAESTEVHMNITPNAIHSEPNTFKSKSNTKPNIGVKKSKRKSSKVRKPKRLPFNIVSKYGRYDHATINRSVTPVVYTAPSKSFQ